MRIACLMHVPFEGPGAIADWAVSRGHELARIDAWRGEFPAPADLGMLVVLGGPMSADDTRRHPWLVPEKAFIGRCLDRGVLTLGICLGAQLLAEATGGSVRRAAEPEIGWYPVTLRPAASRVPYFAGWPETFIAGHWHGDTFDLPEGVEPVASSAITPNQAFVAGDGRAVGLQFHLEWTPEALRALTTSAPEDLSRPSRWIMTAEALLEDPERVAATRALLFGMLDRMEEFG